MSETRPPTIPQFSRRIAVETPEQVLLEFELAGIGSRAAAAILDLLILLGLVFLATVAFALTNVLSLASGAWATAALMLLSAGMVWGYFTLFEGLRGGRTPGKRRLGLRVVMDTGHPVTFQAAVVRNLIRLVDVQPAPAPLVGLFLVFFHKSNKRLGDIAAGTIVVREQVEHIARATAFDDADVVDAGPPALTDEEFRVLGQFLSRAEALQPGVRMRFGKELRNRFGDRMPVANMRTERSLVELYERETAARRGTSGGTRSRSPAGSAAGMARRFVALRQSVWEEFRGRALSLESTGLKQLGGDEVVQFAAQYRDVAADLARARTYGVDARVIAYLDRVVAAGHNVLYGVPSTDTATVAAILLRRLPAAVIQARRYVLAAFVTFMTPAIAGYALIRENPELAIDIMPAEMVARAEAGAEMSAQGFGYAETPSPYLPLVASSIVANNIQVAFGAFAFGVLAGVGTLFVLAFNGLFFGSVLGMFANYGIAGWLLTFVAGHGVLELAAIFIAGAGGLLLGRAVIAPGDMPRRDAIVVNGRLAVKLVGAAICLLLLAGIIEGFLSASDASPTLKIAVSASTVLLLLLYFWAGWHEAIGIRKRGAERGRPARPTEIKFASDT
jgi:uncharacterized membrane protein SpoIIM required for sporulation/uncharacterized RDD family membrane protein YckC